MFKKTGTIFVVFLLLSIGLTAFSITSESMTKTDTTPTFFELVNQVNQSRVRYYLNTLLSFGPRYTGSENCSKAGDWLYSAFSNMGLHVEFHEWDYAGFSSRNIVATLSGTEDSTIEYLLTAHYDTTPGSPGANDDGSGIAAVLAIAEILKGTSFPYTIRFIAFSGEEVGTYGSFCYARDAYRRGDTIRAVINPDIIGYADTVDGGRTIRFFYPERSEWIATFAQNIACNYTSIIDMNVDAFPNYIGADHQAFVDYGYDGVWIAHQDAYQWGHSSEDTANHLNFTYLTKATKLLLAVIAELANTQVPLMVQFTEPYEGYLYFKDNAFIPLDLGKQWYWGLRGITVLIGPTKAKATVDTMQQIEYVIFCVDHNFINWDTNPPYECTITGKHTPLIGKHTVQVYAYSKDGMVAFDEMDIITLSVTSQYS